MKSRKGFKSHIETIRNIEADKDAFLKAARLERHESRSQPLTARQKIILCSMLSASIVLSTILMLGYLSGNFIPAMIGVGIIGTLAGLVAAG